MMVARDGVEPPTPAFSAVFFQPISLIGQQLNLSRWPQFCDHSVTSADVRLSVGHEASETMVGVKFEPPTFGL